MIARRGVLTPEAGRPYNRAKAIVSDKDKEQAMTSQGKRPLAGIRVIDLGRHQAGPRCAQVFARLGAEVIKIERLEGEETRIIGTQVRGQSSYWVQYNSGKQSLTMDLRQPQGKEILKELVGISDVFVQNFRPGTIETMGFGYDVLKALNPRIVMVNISAYGQFGPYRDRIGYDPIGQAISGIMMVTGEEGMPPVRVGVPLIDRTTALHAAIGALAALHERETSGLGQSIDVCLADSGYSLTEIPITAYMGTKKQPARGSKRAVAPSGQFPCKDGWVLVTATDQFQWPRVCKALGKPEWLEDPRFASGSARSENAQVINDAVTDLISGMTRQEAIVHFTEADVTACPVNNIAEAAEDPHPWERRAMVEVPDPIAGSIHVSGDFWHFSRTPAIVGSTPSIGEHNDDILTGLLQHSPDEVAQWVQDGVVGRPQGQSDETKEREPK